MAIIGLIVVIIAVSGYYSLQSNPVTENRSAMMDKYILEANGYYMQIGEKLNQTNELSDTNYSELLPLIDEMIGLMEKKIDADTNALSYADGDYKEVIGLRLQYGQFWLRHLKALKESVEYKLNGDIANYVDAKQRAGYAYSEADNVSNEIADYVFSHPEVKDHVLNYWGHQAF